MLKELFIKLKVVVSGQSGVNSLSNKLNGIKTSSGGVIKAITAISGAGTALYGILWKITTAASDYGDELGKASSKVNMNSDSLQRWAKVAKMNDISLESLTGMLTKYNLNVGKTLQGNKELKSTFDGLGVKLKNNDGTLKSNDETFALVIGRLQQMPSKAERAATAVKLFGKQVALLAPLLDMSGEELNKWWQMDPTLSEEQIKRAQEFDDQMKVVKSTVNKLTLEVGSKLIPIFSKAIGTLQKWFENNKKVINLNLDAAIAKIGKALDKYFTDDNINKVFKGLEKLAGIIFDLFNFVLNNPKLVAGAIAAFITAWSLSSIAPALKGIWAITKGIKNMIWWISKIPKSGPGPSIPMGGGGKELLDPVTKQPLSKWKPDDIIPKTKPSGGIFSRMGNATKGIAGSLGAAIITPIGLAVTTALGALGTSIVIQKINENANTKMVNYLKNQQAEKLEKEKVLSDRANLRPDLSQAQSISNNITVNVPPGTSQEMANYIAKKIQEGIRQAMPNAAR